MFLRVPHPLRCVQRVGSYFLPPPPLLLFFVLCHPDRSGRLFLARRILARRSRSGGTAARFLTLDESMSTASCLSIYLAKYPVFALTFTPSTFVRIPIFRNVPSFALFDG